MFLELILTLFMPVVMLPINIILGCQEKKHKTLYCFLIAFGLAAIAYNFRPFDNQNTDILRHWENMDNTTRMTLEDVDGHRIFSGLPGYYLLLKLFSFAKSKYLLQTVSTLVGYFACLFIIRKFDDAENRKISLLTVFTALSCISFLGFCSGIRQYLVFYTFLLLFYMETVMKKHRIICWCVYFILITFHTSVAFIIVLRVLCSFKKDSAIKFASVLLLFWSTLRDVTVEFISNNFMGNTIADKILELAGFYEENASKIIVPLFVWKIVFLIFCTVVVYFIFNKYDETDTVVTKKYLSFALLSCAFSWGSILEYDVFSRFSVLSFMLVIPLIPTWFKKINSNFKEICRWGLTAFSLLVFIYSMEGYRTFNFNNLVQVLTTNIFTFLGAI